MLLLSRIGSPLCHCYRLISRTGSHAAFRGTYLPRRIRLRGGTAAPLSACSRTCRMNSAAYRLSGECATSICSQTPDCFSVTTTASTERSFQFGRGAGVGVLSSSGDVFRTGIDGSRAPWVCRAGRWASSGPSAVVDCVRFAGVAGSSSVGNKW